MKDDVTVMSLFCSATDVDECSESPELCDGQSVCENTLGSYECVCQPGYQGNGTHCKGKQSVLTSLCGETVPQRRGSACFNARCLAFH